jgi:hypothetical protein
VVLLIPPSSQDMEPRVNAGRFRREYSTCCVIHADYFWGTGILIQCIFYEDNGITVFHRSNKRREGANVCFIKVIVEPEWTTSSE